MDGEITLLAGTAGTTLAALPATDRWNGVRNGVLALGGRVRSDGRQRVATRPHTPRRDLPDAPADGDEEAQGGIAAERRGGIRPLLVAHPEPAAEPPSLLTEPASGTRTTVTVTRRATASGSSRVYQAGRDLNVDQR
ncbi:hypothetical protein [Streptomyces tagetis]|uniref:Uncharacterized protein n=1 Tax=Streptomyces tagetis TaxID=2820809 RepID=A0A940XHM5_9ACTN|nr:hypothetical protein [Streptomyces sp. RG38]MBQ0830583.1 hypothetical protein [Streptomyces sp. RG38]